MLKLTLPECVDTSCVPDNAVELATDNVDPPLCLCKVIFATPSSPSVFAHKSPTFGEL